MDAAEREGLKEQLRAMAAGRGDGIDLDTEDRWVIEGLKNPVEFFRHIPKIVPQGSNFYFEGCSICPEMVQFYEKHRASHSVSVVRDTIFPIPGMFHVSTSAGTVEGLIELLGRHATVECFDHVKAYREERMIFAFHDAFDGSFLLVSDQIFEENIRAFACGVGAVYRREPNENKRDPKQLRKMLSLLENPHNQRMKKSSWKKALSFWKP